MGHLITLGILFFFFENKYKIKKEINDNSNNLT